MTMEIDALYAGLPTRNSLDPCSSSCSEWKAQAERVRVLREALEKTMNYASCDYESPFRPHFDHVMKKARAALEKTK